MPKKSVGLLVFRGEDGAHLEVLLMHPGGPVWASKDLGVWSIPKGEIDPGEDELSCALREFAEEIGAPAPVGEYLDLGEIRQRSGKYVHAFAVRGDLDVAVIESNSFEMEWPPHSGRLQTFPEADRAEWFTVPVARTKVNPAQVPLIDELVALAPAH